MIDAREFERRLFPWIDGQLPAEQAAEMETWCATHPVDRMRVDAERMFEERVRTALLADADGAAVVADAVRRARESAARPAGRRLLLRRAASAAAAVLAVVTAGAWWFCIPPFECAFVQAAEAAATEPPLGEDLVQGEVREKVALVCDEHGCAWRKVVDVGGRRAVVLFTESTHDPSVRRARRIDGRMWWIGDENGRCVVAFRDPASAGLWSFVGEQDEATLLEAARSFRDERERTARK